MSGAIELDEAYVPGGMTWHEATEIPYLADFECSVCGDIGCGCVPVGYPIEKVTRRLGEHENRRSRLDNERHVLDYEMPWWKRCVLVDVDALRRQIEQEGNFGRRTVERLCAVRADARSVA